MHTTLNTIKSHSPCVEGWKTLLKGLNKLEADDEPLHLSQILSINGADDALWSLRAFGTVECRLFAIGAARQVKNLSVSSENLINMAEAYILQVPVNGVSPSSLSELKMALSKEEEAWEATRTAVWTAGAGAVLEEIIKEACAYVESRNG